MQTPFTYFEYIISVMFFIQKSYEDSTIIIPSKGENNEAFRD